MFNSVKNFLRDEGGNVTIESLVVIGGSIWMMGVVVTDVSVATMGVTERLNDRLEYTSIVADILNDYGAPENDSDFCNNNPGNAKCVGNATENPNGKGGWGTGETGQGDVNGNANSGINNGNGGGNNGGGNGNSNNL